MRRAVAVLVGLTVLVSMEACGGDGAGPADEDEPGSEEVGPARGGSLTYALEAETGDGWCLPESQLAISGIMVARVLYDTLTAPNADGEYVPYLASSVEPSDGNRTWTITLRDGVTFHDGSPLTAEVVKNNLDAYRGEYDGRNPLLFLFVLDNIDTVEVTGELEVTVTTKVPWAAFPAFLHSSGRLGIVGQAQLDDAESCDRNLIGTGPFALESWRRDVELVATANEDYWQTAPDGKAYPYLDEIRFQPVTNAEQRVNALESGDIDLMHDTTATSVLTLDDLAADGTVDTYASDRNAEVGFFLLNESRPPFDDARVRRAMALGLDRDEYTEVVNRGLFTLASGPFAPGSIAHLDDTGYPSEPDLDEARRLVAAYETDKGALPTVGFQTGPSPDGVDLAVYVSQAMAEIGLDVEIETVQQGKVIGNAISGEFDMMAFRNYPGGDPDELYVWFHSGSPANFARIDDPEVDALLEVGRIETDPHRRTEIYQDLNRELGAEVHGLWINWTTWVIGSKPEVGGYTPDTAPPLPDGSAPVEGLATGHPVHGLWITD